MALTPGQNVAVIGAGPMGLACAHALATAGCRVTLFEADDRIGGMSAFFDFDGLAIERYYHFICKPDAPLFAVLDEFGLTDRLRWRPTEMGFYYQGNLYRWGRPDCLLRFPHLRLQDKLRYALHVMYTKGMKDWRALDRIEATGWLRRWVGERAYRGALAAALRAQVLRACPGALGGLDRHPHQAGCPLAQEPVPGGARLPGGRLPGAAGRLPHPARGPGRAHPAQGARAAGHDRRRTGHRRGGRGSNPPRRGGHLHRAPQVRAPLRAGSDGRQSVHRSPPSRTSVWSVSSSSSSARSPPTSG